MDDPVVIICDKCFCVSGICPPKNQAFYGLVLLLVLDHLVKSGYMICFEFLGQYDFV
jgi:hypothetical protein